MRYLDRDKLKFKEGQRVFVHGLTNQGWKLHSRITPVEVEFKYDWVGTMMGEDAELIFIGDCYSDSGKRYKSCKARWYELSFYLNEEDCIKDFHELIQEYVKNSEDELKYAQSVYDEYTKMANIFNPKKLKIKEIQDL